jgi:hypothetical protein
MELLRSMSIRDLLLIEVIFIDGRFTELKGIGWVVGACSIKEVARYREPPM